MMLLIMSENCNQLSPKLTWGSQLVPTSASEKIRTITLSIGADCKRIKKWADTVAPLKTPTDSGLFKKEKAPAGRTAIDHCWPHSRMFVSWPRRHGNTSKVITFLQCWALNGDLMVLVSLDVGVQYCLSANSSLREPPWRQQDGD